MEAEVSATLPAQGRTFSKRTAMTAVVVVAGMIFFAANQSMHGAPPPAEELKAFCARLKDIQAAGGRIKLVQVYTVAREPAERWVAALSDGEVDAIVAQVQRETGLHAEAFYGLCTITPSGPHHFCAE